MGLESKARAWAHRRGLQDSHMVVGAYRSWTRLRFRNAWDKPVPFHGCTFVIGRDLSLFPAVHNGGFEAAELTALLPRIDPRATVWDVGGNIGIYSVLLARAAHRGQVVAFEPVPDSRARLEGNLHRNGIKNVTVESTALSAKSGVAHMAVHNDAHGCDSLEIQDSDDASARIEVITIAGDEYATASPWGMPSVIKVDIEGHEPEFVQGAWGVIARHRPILMLEVNPTTWTTPTRFAVWADMLEKLFTVYGTADWFDAKGRRRIERLDVGSLEHRLYTLIFPAWDEAEELAHANAYRVLLGPDDEGGEHVGPDA